MLLYNLATVNILIVQAFASSCFLKKKKKASSWGFNQALKVFISLIKAYLHHNQGNFLSLIIWSVLLKWKHVLIPRDDINGGTAMALWYSTLPVSTTTPNLVIFDWRKKKKKASKREENAI